MYNLTLVKSLNIFLIKKKKTTRAQIQNNVLVNTFRKNVFHFNFYSLSKNLTIKNLRIHLLQYSFILGFFLFAFKKCHPKFVRGLKHYKRHFMVGAAHESRLMRDRCKDSWLVFPLLGCLRHQAINLVLQAGKVS